MMFRLINVDNTTIPSICEKSCIQCVRECKLAKSLLKTIWQQLGKLKRHKPQTRQFHLQVYSLKKQMLKYDRTARRLHGGYMDIYYYSRSLAVFRKYFLIFLKVFKILIKQSELKGAQFSMLGQKGVPQRNIIN